MELRTSRLILRPWAAGDEASLVRYADNWNVARHLRDRFPHPYTREAARAWIAHNAAAPAPALDLALVLAGEAVGGLGFLPESDISRCALELGYWLGEPFWGRGLVAEAIAAAVPYAFAALPEVAVIVAKPFAANAASARVLEKCGFALCGRLPDAAIKRGELSDVLLYARTRELHGDRAPGPELAVLEGVRAWDRAMVTNDAAAIGRSMADDWRIFGPDGSAGTKASFLALVRSGELTHDVMESHDLEIRIYGEAAVVTARGVSGGQYRGEPFHLVERTSCVFIRQDGEWRCVLTHLSHL
jgi:[ribosomal protein S5]-alanine N-acetyltransferase